MTSWDTHFFSIAALWAQRSKDPSTQVGALLVSPNRRLSIPGYNGFPALIADQPDLLADRPTRIALTLHAELNAILQAQRPLAGWTCYVTVQPCSQCLAALVQERVARVVCPRAPADLAARWGMDTPAYQLLAAATQLHFTGE